MGMFDFVSTVGKKLGIEYFEQQERAKKIDEESARVAAQTELAIKLRADMKAKVESLGLKLESFNVLLDGATAQPQGTVQSQADKEKVVMCLGNFAGVDRVDDAALRVVNPEPPGVFHEVRKGDTLSLIAKAYYGIIMAYPEIATANQPLIENVDKITPGWIVRIPVISHIVYTSKQGDTLSGIAKTMYGDLKKYPVIFEANTDQLSNPDVLKPNTALKIPILFPLPQARPNVS